MHMRYKFMSKCVGLGYHVISGIWYKQQFSFETCSQKWPKITQIGFHFETPQLVFWLLVHQILPKLHEMFTNFYPETLC